MMAKTNRTLQQFTNECQFVCEEVTQQHSIKKPRLEIVLWPSAPAIFFTFNFCHAESAALLVKVSVKPSSVI